MEAERKTIKTFEDLEVYQRAYRISLDVHQATLMFPSLEQYALGDQIRRASKSICANIAEGFAKQHDSTADFKRFLVMALGSSEEMKVWSDYARDLGYVSSDQAKAWRDEYAQLSRMIFVLKKNWN